MSDGLLRVFNFEVQLLRSPDETAGAFGTSENGSGPASSGDTLGDGGFQECSGLEIELDVQELYEGGRNDGVIRRVGRAKFQNIVLKRGMFFIGDEPSSAGLQTELWGWLMSIASGVVPVPRYDGLIRVKEGGETVATWSFVRGLPAKIRGPALNAQTGDIAIEELYIAHEGLRLEGI